MNHWLPRAALIDLRAALDCSERPANPLPMDTLTHALSGALLGRALAPPPRAGGGKSQAFGPRVPVWHAVVAGGVAATFPDADYVLTFVSELAYLRGHRGVTHSIVLLPLWALVLGWLLAIGLRNRSAWKRYAWLAAAGIAIHIAGDWITQFGTMLLAPLSDARFGLGSTFIIDLVLSGIIVAGLLGSALWARSRAPALLALALLPAWVGVGWLGKSEAIAFAREYAQRHGIAAVTIDAAPRPASPFNWTIIVDEGDAYHVAHINTRRSEPLVAGPDDNFIRRFSAPYLPLAQARWERRPKFGAPAVTALAHEVWSDPQFELVRWFSMYPLLYQVDRGESGTCAWFHDLRFDYPGRGFAPFRFGLCRAGSLPWRLYRLDGADRRVPVG
jgi:inner membrane protein